MKFLLIILNFGVHPTAIIHDDFNTAQACWEASLTHMPAGKQKRQTDFFVTCAGTDEPSEETLAITIAQGMGYDVN